MRLLGVKLLGVRLLRVRLLGLGWLGVWLLGVRRLGVRLLGVRLLGVRLLGGRLLGVRRGSVSGRRWTSIESHLRIRWRRPTVVIFLGVRWSLIGVVRWWGLRTSGRVGDLLPSGIRLTGWPWWTGLLRSRHRGFVLEHWLMDNAIPDLGVLVSGGRRGDAIFGHYVDDEPNEGAHQEYRHVAHLIGPCVVQFEVDPERGDDPDYKEWIKDGQE
jgi:hypothetical protein